MADFASFGYAAKQLRKRRTQTTLTAVGISLVVFVFAATLMLSEGLRRTLASTGHPENVIFLRTGATNEIQSAVSREHVAIILSHPSLLRTAEGEAAASGDVLMLISLQKRADGQRSNVSIRGVGKQALLVRPEVRLVSGRFPQRGTREIMVGAAINQKFSGTDIGQQLRLVGTDWPVVGVFDAGNSAFSSEIWGDVDTMMPAFRRDRYSSITARLKSPTEYARVKDEIENDRRLSISLQSEREFYESLSELLAMFIRIMGGFISIIFSFGAAIGAMLTMYSSVANRTREIGVLRALGFSRPSIFQAFTKECLLIGALGGGIGILAASLLSFASVATTNFSTFADLSFGFHLTPIAALLSLLFALVMGLIGGALPAIRASRLNIVEAIRGR